MTSVPEQREETESVTFSIDLRGSTKVDPSFLSVEIDLDPDLFSGDRQRMRERAAEHYGVPIEQVVEES